MTPCNSVYVTKFRRNLLPPPSNSYSETGRENWYMYKEKALSETQNPTPSLLRFLLSIPVASLPTHFSILKTEVAVFTEVSVFIYQNTRHQVQQYSNIDTSTYTT